MSNFILTFKQFIFEDSHPLVKVKGRASMLHPPSDKTTREKMHSPKLDGKDRRIPGLMASFQSGENRTMNRKMREGKKMGNTAEEPHGDIHTAFQDVIGRGSEHKKMAVSHPGILYHGQTHDPEPDKDGIIHHKAFTSWSSNPSVAMQFAKPKGQDKGADYEAHHILVMHHDPENKVGHSLFSLHSKEHSSAMKREEEVVGGPVKYKVKHADYVGDHPETGKPVYEYHVEPHEAHPNWNSKAHGPLTPAEKEKIKHW